MKRPRSPQINGGRARMRVLHAAGRGTPLPEHAAVVSPALHGAGERESDHVSVGPAAPPLAAQKDEMAQDMLLLGPPGPLRRRLRHHELPGARPRSSR